MCYPELLPILQINELGWWVSFSENFFNMLTAKICYNVVAQDLFEDFGF